MCRPDATNPKLTRKDQVLAAVAAGARIKPLPDRPGMLRLMTGDTPIDAWQTALQSAKRALEDTQ